MKRALPLIQLAAFVLLGFDAAAAAAGGTTGFAIIIGSNRPGEGQAPLSFAWADADRFKAALSDVGGYSDENIVLLRDPDILAVERALDRVSATVQRRHAAGEKTSFVFYYSGHARATALNIGVRELPLSTLRGRVEAVAADFKLVVLDACQTGAISNVKGVSPTADFSYNSVVGLNNEGLVVLASSAASELAQESSRIKGSFFTHHLVAALRGAADSNEDGLVTLDETYRYTYNRTLVDTAKTAVGKQHVTLETDLRGKGETVLSRPGDQSSRLVFDAAFSGEALIVRKADSQVMAELHKTAGNRMQVALPPSSYDIIVRRAARGFACSVALARDTRQTVSLRSCRPIRLEEQTPKGDAKEHLFFEVGFGLLFGRRDAYTERLGVFDFQPDDADRRYVFHFSAGAHYSVLKWLKIGVHYSLLDGGDYSASSELFGWRAHRLGLSVRGVLPLARGIVALYAQVTGGPSFAGTSYEDAAPQTLTTLGAGVSVADHERFLGYHVAGGGGVRILPWRHGGVTWQIEYIYAPIVENLLGDTHDSGGIATTLGVTGGF